MTRRSIPTAALRRLGEIVPISMTTAQVAKIADWAAELVEAAVAQARADAGATGLRNLDGAMPIVQALPTVPPSTAAVRDGRAPTARAPRKAPNAWSEAELLRCMTMAREGATARAIADALDRPHGAVAHRLVMMRRKGQLPPGGLPTGEAWGEAETAELLRRAKAGETSRGIAEALGRTPRSIEVRLARLRAAGADAPKRVAGGARTKAEAAKTPKPTPEVESVAAHGPRQAPQMPEAAAAPAPIDDRPAQPDPKPAPVCQPAPVPPADDIEDDAPAYIPACIHKIAADISGPARPVVQRAMAHLDRVKPDPRLTPDDDTRLLVEIILGVPSAVLADQLGLEPKELGARFRAMVPAELRDVRGHLSLDGGKVLLEAAKRNAMEG